MQAYFNMILAGALTVPMVVAAADLPDADEIARQVNARDEGVAVARKLEMQMTDRRGKKRVRITRGFRKYYGDEKRTVIFYMEPSNVRGTAFLTWDYPESDRDDDQWLYLPAMRKVRRISASDRGDYFLGTDLTYEDIKLETRISMEDYRRRTIGEDEVDGHHCYLIESVPVDKETARELGYGMVEQCVDDSIWMVRRARFRDRKGNALKTVLFRDIRQIQGIWTQHRIEVENHRTGHRTLFLFSEVDYRHSVDDALFTQAALRRGNY
ncbi:MAG TPA: outer membrane lipoprotein-sorting protein [Gammaproteobacteria bacterium]|nr:outer membrane lipoprotein-sorting protein [Gammaproteobacteria bacterium]